jgi:hypothetical protein
MNDSPWVEPVLFYWHGEKESGCAGFAMLWDSSIDGAKIPRGEDDNNSFFQAAIRSPDDPP